MMKKIAIVLTLCASLCAYGIDIKKEVIVENESTFAQTPVLLQQAKWIWPEVPAGDITNIYALFRDSFSLDNVPSKALLTITADQNYALFVNGKFVGSGPARGYQYSWSYDEIDIAKYLRKGKNVLAVRVYNLGSNNFQYISEGMAGLLYSLDLGDGNVRLSDGNVRCRTQKGCDRDTERTSIQTNRQEHIDLRVEDPKWTEIDFDDSKWRKPFKPTVFNAMPYYSFEPRSIPMMETCEMNVARLIASGEGVSKSDSIRYRNLCELADIEKTKLSLVAEQKSAIVPATEKGKVREYLFDFGKMLVGFPVIKIEGAKGGEVIDIIYDEVVDSNYRIPNRWNTWNRPAFASRVICKEGKQRHQFFHLYGFRYALVRVKGNVADLKITPSIIWSAYPLDDKGVFKVSDSYVQKIWEACKQTQKICSLDAYVDTPYREQAHWWGDARVQGWNTFFISGDDRLLRRGIRTISRQTAPNGLTYGLAPTTAHTCILPDYCLTWILTLYDYYWQTGSAEAYTSHKDTVEGLIKYFESHKDAKTGLIKHDPRYWLFLDWTRIQKVGQPSVLNLWYLHALDKLVEICENSNLKDDASKYAKLAKNIRFAITKNLLDKDGLICDGILPDGTRNQSKSIHSQTLGKICNIEGLDFAKAKNEIIMPFVRDGKIPQVRPSSYWVVYVLQVLIDDGSAKEAFEFIKRNWKNFAEFGTTWEDYGPMGGEISHSHAWSAHPAFLLPQILGGIKQEAPAWKKVSVKPNCFVDDVEISYPTPQGDLIVSYKKNANGQFDVQIDAPKNIKISK